MSVQTVRYYERRGLLTEAQVKARAEAKIEDVDRRIHDLQHIKHALTHSPGSFMPSAF